MDIVDILIMVVLVSFAIIGFRRGVFQSLAAFIGFIAVICVSYWLKNYLGDFFVMNLPFSNYTFIPGGSVVLNIITYQSLAFLIMLVILGVLYKILLITTGFFEKILRVTIILGIPSKILGLIVGALEGYIIVYLLLFFVSQPYLRFGILDNSKYAKVILTDTPVLSDVAKDTFTIINEIDETLKNNDEENFDLKLTNLILKRNITSANVMQKLVDNKKIEVDGIQEVIDIYKWKW